MIDRNIVERPVFQMNLILFLSWPAPIPSTITPIFFLAEYELSLIERTFAVPPPAVITLRDAGVPIQWRVEPDVLLDRAASRTLLPIECKASSFGVDTSQARQARGLLVLTASELANLLGKPPGEIWNEVLTYASAFGHGELLLTTLQELSAQLSEHGLDVVPVASLDLEHRPDDGIYLHVIPGSAELPGLEDVTPLRVVQLDRGEDPRLLYLLPYMPGGEHERDAVGEQVFHERLRLAAVLLFGQLDARTHEYDIDDMISKTIQVWNKWENEASKKHIRGHARAFLRTLFNEIRAAVGVACEIRGRTITIPAVSTPEATRIRRYLQTRGVVTRPLDFTGPLQPPLTDLLDDE